MKNSDEIIEFINEENDDYYTDDSMFNISSWGADLSFREIISMYDEDELVKPELQRKYVWDKVEASRFIESLLMGLPVPSIFLAQSGSQKLIIDGYQRIMTVYDYVNGIFSTDKKIFKLSNSEKINKRWRNKAFKELTSDEKRKIRSTTIHAIVFEQKKPENNDTSLYQIFERINTSGRTLMAQEIRNCIYQGTLNTLLFELNKNEKWRILFGLEQEDDRMRDLEYILRFFAFKSDGVRQSKKKQLSLKKTLNIFMGKYAHADVNIIDKFRDDFLDTINIVFDVLGQDAFHNFSNGKFTKKFHPAIYDAIMVAFFELRHELNCHSKISVERHVDLLRNAEFNKTITMRTTDIDNINDRIDLVKKMVIEGIE